MKPIEGERGQQPAAVGEGRAEADVAPSCCLENVFGTLKPQFFDHHRTAQGGATQDIFECKYVEVFSNGREHSTVGSTPAEFEARAEKFCFASF